MEVDNVQKQRNTTLTRAIETVTKATELDVGGLYEEAVAHYDAALTDFDWVISFEKSQVVRDCVLSKMDAYAYRSGSLKKFLRRSRSPGSDGDSEGAAETSASSDSGVDTVDDLGAGTHNVSADSATDESGYATIYEPRQHQQQSRQQFLDACAQQVEQLLQIINDENEPDHIRERARERCEQILDFAVAYRRDFCPATSATASDPPPPPTPPVPVEGVVRTVSVASSVAPADEAFTHQLVHAEVLLSADDEQHAAGPADQKTTEPQEQQDQQREEAGDDQEGGEEDSSTEDGEECPGLPDDGDKEFNPLTFSMDSLRFVDDSSGPPSSRRSDSPDYATVRRATPSPRKLLSQASLNKIESECEPLLDGRGGGGDCALMPAAVGGPSERWWRRRRADGSRPEPMEERLTQPSMFWVVLGSICG